MKFIPHQLVIRVGAMGMAASQLLHDGILAGGLKRQVDIDRGAQHFAYHGNRPVDPGHIRSYREICAQAFWNQLQIQPHEPVDHVLHRGDGKVQRHQFALHVVHALCRVAVEHGGEDVPLQFLQFFPVVAYGGQQVVVHDEVEHAVRAIARTEGEWLRACSQQRRTGVYDSDAPRRTITR